MWGSPRRAPGQMASILSGSGRQGHVLRAMQPVGGGGVQEELRGAGRMRCARPGALAVPIRAQLARGASSPRARLGVGHARRWARPGLARGWGLAGHQGGLSSW